MDKKILLERIKEAFPKLTIESAELNKNGQNNHVIIINDSYVFRFPKYKEGMANLRMEANILSMLADKLTLPIPYPELCSLEETQIDKAFVGYRMLAGQPMWADEITGVDRNGLKKLAKQLTAFLVKFHSIPVSTLDPVIVKNSDHPVSEVESLYTALIDKVFHFMSKEARNTVSSSFESFIIEQKNNMSISTLIHGDFGASNILWDADKVELTGVIDFGGTRIGDPAYDFAGVLACYGENFFNLCLRHYPDGDGISERVKFYRSTFALQEALHGIENNDPRAFENGIRNYL